MSFSEQTQPPQQQLSPQAYYTSPALPAEESWYPDTGATHHMKNTLQHLNVSHEDYHGQDQIRVGDGTGLPVSHIGSASLSLSRRTFVLNQLLRVPSICKNLLSVRQFALDNSVFFEFHSSYFVIKDSQTGIILHQGRTKDGLYHLLPSSSSPPINQALVGDRTSSISWHKRFEQSTALFLSFSFQFIPIRLSPLARSVHKLRVINCRFLLLLLAFVNL
jgi:hypothetical protein